MNVRESKQEFLCCYSNIIDVMPSFVFCESVALLEWPGCDFAGVAETKYDHPLRTSIDVPLRHDEVMVP